MQDQTESNFENNSHTVEEEDPDLVNCVRAKPVGLPERLQLQQIAGCDVFVVKCYNRTGDRTPWGSLFGGQVLAQSVVAARQTVPENQRIHSLHGYFLLKGQSGIELLFEVQRVHDGRSFAKRVVKVLQENKVIFQVLLSFHVDEVGLEWQTPSRDVEMMAKSRGLGSIPLPEELIKAGVEADYHPADRFNLTEALLVAEGRWWNMRWVRHRTKIPDDNTDTHAAVLSWLSDYFVVPRGKQVHSIVKSHSMQDELERNFENNSFREEDPDFREYHNSEFYTSIDHAIHFHRPIYVDEWLLFHTRTMISAGARALSRTEIFDSEGQLSATVTQEALIRTSYPEAKL